MSQRALTTSISASSSAHISSVQKGDNFEKKVLNNLKHIDNLSCKKIK